MDKGNIDSEIRIIHGNNDDIRAKGVDTELKSDLNIIYNKRGYPTLSAYLRIALRKVADEELKALRAEGKIVPQKI